MTFVNKTIFKGTVGWLVASKVIQYSFTWQNEWKNFFTVTLFPTKCVLLLSEHLYVVNF